jgi:hypothetical protein
MQVRGGEAFLFTEVSINNSYLILTGGTSLLHAHPQISKVI